MKFLLNGYFGFGNAGDEAVLAAMLVHLRVLRADATFVVTSGAPEHTRRLHGVEAVGRQSPRELLAALRECDVFLSGGGSLVQDVTSVRNAIYYTGLLRTARLLGKPTMVYAQGVGPLNTSVARRACRAAFQKASLVTVRDEDSAQLLRDIGVTRPVEITADPVWDLGTGVARRARGPAKKWVAALRSWPGAEAGALSRVVEALRDAAQQQAATLQFLPMQPEHDEAILRGLAAPEEILDTHGRHPRAILEMVADADLMLAMRLHALIFAASVGVPVVAFDYDPKVRALAKLLRAPLVPSPRAEDLQRLNEHIENARAPDADRLEQLKIKARRNAELASRLK